MLQQDNLSTILTDNEKLVKKSKIIHSNESIKKLPPDITNSWAKISKKGSKIVGRVKTPRNSGSYSPILGSVANPSSSWAKISKNS
jgi:hypothetical protein